MPVKGSLIKETVIFDADRVNDTVDNGNDDENTVLPINTRAIVGVANVNDRSNELGKTEISRGNSDYEIEKKKKN